MALETMDKAGLERLFEPIKKFSQSRGIKIDVGEDYAYLEYLFLGTLNNEPFKVFYGKYIYEEVEVKGPGFYLLMRNYSTVTEGDSYEVMSKEGEVPENLVAILNRLEPNKEEMRRVKEMASTFKTN